MLVSVVRCGNVRLQAPKALAVARDRGKAPGAVADERAKALESWDSWKKRVDLRGHLPSVEKAKRHLEEHLERHAASSRLPWL